MGRKVVAWEPDRLAGQKSPKLLLKGFPIDGAGIVEIQRVPTGRQYM
jgi:hypothetical protein